MEPTKREHAAIEARQSSARRASAAVGSGSATSVKIPRKRRSPKRISVVIRPRRSTAMDQDHTRRGRDCSLSASLATEFARRSRVAAPA